MLTSGTRLGPYEIVGPLGAGGMGQVYRARDTRLGRDVAVKVLSPSLSTDPVFRARFEREARAVSRLNHPHICTLHDVGHADDIAFIVMEHLEGETLARRLERGPLPTEVLLRHAVEIAAALDRAHRSGIIHRDLKPANVMLTRDGAKLMDFGLARATGAELSGSTSRPLDLGQTPASDQALTVEGSIVGTLQYMAPEQLEGKEADARTDLFAFGAMLFEMATGRKAFEGSSQASLIGAIMHREPPAVTSVVPTSPMALDQVVRACLAKNPDERIQTAHDLKLQLEWIRDAGAEASVPVRVAALRHRRQRLAWIVAASTALLLAVASAILVPRLTRNSVPAPVVRFSVTGPVGVSLRTDPRGSVISPDGRRLAFLAADSNGTTSIWVQPLDSLASKRLAGTENADLPFWSPDNRFIAFFADTKLKKIAAAGGTPEAICDVRDTRGGSWSRDDVILFAPMAAGPLMRVPADGSEPEEVLRPDSTRHETGLRFPEFLPDGKHFLFVSLPARQGNFDVYVGTLSSKERRRVLASGSAPVYAEPGWVIMTRNAQLMAQRFDPRRLQPMGDPIPIGAAPAASSMNGARAASVSTNGVLAYLGIGLPNTQLMWLDRAGRQVGTIALTPARYEGAAISPDGQRLAVEKRSSATSTDLWMVELPRAVATRFTFLSAPTVGRAFWSPDGRWVAFNCDRSGPLDIYRKRTDGNGEEEPVLQSSGLFKEIQQWSFSGRELVFTQPDASTAWDVWTLPMDGERKPVPFMKTRFNETFGAVSPDGRWMAYTSDESGKPEVYVQSFPTAGTKYQVSTAGGFRALWSKDGRELLLVGPDGTLFSVQVQSTPTFKADTPRVLFRPRPDLVGLAATADLERLLVTAPAAAATPASITIELNWMSALNR